MSKPKTIVTNPELKQMLATLRFREDADLEQKALEHIANQAHFLSAVHPAKDSQPGEQKYDFPRTHHRKRQSVLPHFHRSGRAVQMDGGKRLRLRGAGF